MAYSLEDHKAWFRRAGALEGLGRTLWSWSSSLIILEEAFDDMTYEKEHGQNYVKIYEHIHVFYLGFRFICIYTLLLSFFLSL